MCNLFCGCVTDSSTTLYGRDLRTAELLLARCPVAATVAADVTRAMVPDGWRRERSLQVG